MAELVSGILGNLRKLLSGYVFFLYSSPCNRKFLCLLYRAGKKMETTDASCSMLSTLRRSALFLFAGDEWKINLLCSVAEVEPWKY